MTYTFNVLLKQYQKNKKTHDWIFLSSLSNLECLGPILTGMANTNGGHIAIGIDFKNFHLRGCEIPESEIDMFIENTITPPLNLDYETITRGNKAIKIIHVTLCNDGPYTYLKKCYMHAPEGTHLATIEEESRLQDYFSEKRKLNRLKEVASDTESALHKRQRKALHYLKKNKFIKNKDYRELYMVSHKTAHLELVELVSLGYIVSQGSGRSTGYILANKQSPVSENPSSKTAQKKDPIIKLYTPHQKAVL